MIKQRDFWIFLLLSIVTCGIYTIYFWYCVNEDINAMCQGDGESYMNFIVVYLLGIVTCGIFLFYWFYKLANRLQKNAARYGLSMQENGTTVLMWMIFGSLLCGIGYYYAMYLIIKNTNQIADSYNRYNGFSTPQM